jgi:hypothetical protein
MAPSQIKPSADALPSSGDKLPVDESEGLRHAALEDQVDRAPLMTSNKDGRAENARRKPGHACLQNLLPSRVRCVTRTASLFTSAPYVFPCRLPLDIPGMKPP